MGVLQHVRGHGGLAAELAADNGHSAPTQSERMRQNTCEPGATRAIFSTSAVQSTAKRRTPSA